MCRSARDPPPPSRVYLTVRTGRFKFRGLSATFPARTGLRNEGFQMPEDLPLLLHDALVDHPEVTRFSKEPLLEYGTPVRRHTPRPQPRGEASTGTRRVWR